MIVRVHCKGTGIEEVNHLIPDCTVTHVLPKAAGLNLLTDTYQNAAANILLAGTSFIRPRALSRTCLVKYVTNTERPMNDDSSSSEAPKVKEKVHQRREETKTIRLNFQ